jgi:hypothetical protein
VKKLFALAAIAMSMASPALADDAADVAQAYAAFQYTQAVIYHSGCEKLPDVLMYGVVQEMKKIPEATMIAADEKIHDEMVRDGSGAAWCARVKPIIWKRIKEIMQ